MRQKTIFRQLIINVVFPVLFAFLILAILNYYNTKNLLLEASQTENRYISDEITNTIEFQDIALDLLEERLGKRMKSLSQTLVHEYFQSTRNIEEADLFQIREELGMDPKLSDIYIINKNGIVVNTTFEQDLYLDFFSFGEAHKQFLLEILENRSFVNDRFAIEATTKRLKKYSYQSTLDGKFIVEIGFYSEKADEIIQKIKTYLNEISQKKETILSVDLFIVTDKPFSLNKESRLSPEEVAIIDNVVSKQTNYVKEMEEEGNDLLYEYILIDRQKTSLYKQAVIRIASNKSPESDYLRSELLKLLLAFIIVILIVVILMYRNSRAITQPIAKLLSNVDRVAEGEFDLKVKMEGFSEISKLADGFNIMLEYILNRNIEIEEQAKELRVFNKNLNDAYELLNKQKNIIESKNKDLTSSINYSLRIQRSFIPSIDSLYELFPDSFVYYLPRDIVSGDFYWFTRINHTVILVAADCTGHGVPGAFTSLIGMSLLHQIVNHEKIHDPAEILTQMDKEIYEMLKQSLNQDNFFVGMDVSVVSIDTKNHKLLFSGAQRPLLILHDDQLKHYRGDIYPIGEYYNKLDKKFTNTTIDLYIGDVLYMFSDGYTTQFSGESDKKFTVKRLQELLIRIKDLPLKEQRAELNKIFLDWKGTKPQIDDILVLGFRYAI